MKNSASILITYVLLSSLTGLAQQKLKPIKSFESIFVSDIMTTHLIFNEKITYVDIGSPYFIADTVQSMIKLRHIGEDVKKPIAFKTNITAMTEDGAYYSFPLIYDREASVLNYKVDQVSTYVQKPRRKIESEAVKEQKIHFFANKLRGAPSNFTSFAKREDFTIGVSGIYYEEDFIGLRFIVENTSSIDLDIDHILIRLKLKKRISPDYIYQERIIKPIVIVDERKKIKGYTTAEMILIFNRFTPNRHEKLTIDVLEKGGGRSATMAIPRKKIINPKTL